MINEWTIAVYNDRRLSQTKYSEKRHYIQNIIYGYIILHLYKVYKWENWNMVSEIKKGVTFRKEPSSNLDSLDTTQG